MAYLKWVKTNLPGIREKEKAQSRAGLWVGLIDLLTKGKVGVILNNSLLIRK